VNTLVNKGTASRQDFSTSAKPIVIAALCFIGMMSAARAQDARPAEPMQDAQQQSDDPKTEDQDAESPVNGLLQVNEQPPQQPSVAVNDAEIVFKSPGAATYSRDIRLSDNLGGLRFYGTNSLTSTPDGAAIQLFGNKTSLNGQLFLDSGANNAAALIFRTAPTNGTITERMRIASNGNVAIGATGTSTAS
jgi:hypothetical protein